MVTIDCSILVNIFFIVVPPQIIPFEFGEEPIDAGDLTTVQCAISKGDYPIKIEWKLNNKAIRTDDGISIETKKKVSILTIDSAEAIHSGTYTCSAKNLAGSVDHSALLAINGLLFRVLFILFWYFFFV